ncbi:MAG: winged helix-turn-helix transcriptional regulator [Euryarchaeota archaeon]|nr:winged helix-turn-helix transcriptional regulator [Euryarchaeota archaeon]
MRNAIGVAAAVFLALLVFLPSTQASPGNLVATTGAPVKLYGDAAVKARDGLVVLDPAEPLTFPASGATITHVRVTSSFARLPTGAEILGARDIDSEPVDAEGSTARLVPASDAFVSVRARDITLSTRQATAEAEPPADLWRDAHAQLGILLGDETLGPALPGVRLGQASAEEPIPGFAALAAGTYVAEAFGSRVTLKADELVVAGATLEVGPQTLVAERRTTQAPGAVFVPDADGGTWTGPGSHSEETLDYYVLALPGAGFDVTVREAELVSGAVFILHDGFVGLPWAEGSLETDAENVRLHGEQTILGGVLRLRPVSVDLDGAPRITLLGDGDVAFVRVGVESTTFANAEAAAVAGGAAAGLGLVALAVYYWPTLKYALSAALLPLYARVPKEQTLDHKGRELLYDLVKNEPGISTNQLAKEVPFGWSTLTYHLRVLERNEAIVSVRDGRYKRFFDRASGRFSNGRKYILAVLKNDATLGIARFIKEKPGSSQKEVAGTFQLSPSSVHWHVERLNEVGLVEKIREAHNVKYFPGEAWGHVTLEDLKTLEPKPDAPGGATVVQPATVPGADAQPSA